MAGDPMTVKVRAILTLIFLVLLAPLASAHPLDLGYLQIEMVDKSIHVSLQMNPLAAHSFAGVDGKATLPKEPDQLFNSTLGKATWLLNEKECPWRDASWRQINNGNESEQIEISAIADCGGISGSLQVRLPFLVSAPSSYRVLGRLTRGEDQQTFIADANNVSAKIEISTPSIGFFEFAHMGIAHIGALPSEWLKDGRFKWPDGIDHILFVLAIVLGGGTARSLVKTISGFTLGHSITLGLSTLNIIHFPTRIVESFIALSIVYVALEACLIKQAKHRWKIAAIFGLFHGFGFASALNELELSRHNLIQAILGFNSGVEIGQILIIALTLPIVYLLRTSSGLFPKLALKTSALGIAGAGSYWFIERLFY